MEPSFMDTKSHEINRLWSKIYQQWEKMNNSHISPDEACNKVIDIYSKLLTLISEETEPLDYYFVLRKRAQHYSLLNRFDDALDDLYREGDHAWRNNDNLRVKECQELISQISAWNLASKISADF